MLSKARTVAVKLALLRPVSVKMWAEKEMRNLARISRAGLRCPAPLAIRSG